MRRAVLRHIGQDDGAVAVGTVGQQFIVENRPGASSVIATEVVVRAPADGYTLLAIAPASTVNASLIDKLPFNFLRDTAPIAGIMRVPNVLVVYPGFPARSVPEFIAYVKANPARSITPRQAPERQATWRASCSRP